MRIRTGAFGQLYSMDFQYSITLSSGFWRVFIETHLKCNLIFFWSILFFFIYLFISFFLFFSHRACACGVLWFWCVTPCLSCTELKCIECMQNVVWHSYQSLSMEMDVPTDSRIRVHSVVQGPVGLGSLSLSLSLQKHATIHNQKTHTINIQFTLSRPDLALSLLVFKHFFKHIQQISLSFEKLSTHIGHLAVYFSWFTACLPSPVMEKKGTQTDTLSRWKWEFDIVSYRQHLFAGDMLVHWYVWAISSSVWHWWPSGCCKDWQKFSDSQ